MHGHLNVKFMRLVYFSASLYEVQYLTGLLIIPMICSSKWGEYRRINARSSEGKNVHFLSRVSFCNYFSYTLSNSMVFEPVRSTIPFPLTPVVSVSRQPTLMLAEICQRSFCSSNSLLSLSFLSTQSF